MTQSRDMDRSDLKEKMVELIATAKRSFALGLQTNSGGNLSVRLACGDAIVIKPSGMGFNECAEDNLMVCDLSGEVLIGDGKPSKDLEFHCAIYRVQPDAGAIVHVHSPWAIGYSHLGVPLRCTTVQSVGKLGDWIPCIDLAPGGGPQGAAEVAPVFADPGTKAALLRSHGTIGVGKTLMSAQYIVELLEETVHGAYAGTVFRRFQSNSVFGEGDLVPAGFASQAEETVP